MYCKNCGNEVNQNSLACLNCGTDPNKGSRHCNGCGVETSSDQVICIKCGISLNNQAFSFSELKRKVMNVSNDSKEFPIPLGVCWAINIIGWVLFVSTRNHVVEILTCLLSLGCLYVALQHKKINTPPFLSNEKLSANNLIYASAFEAIWMLSFALDLF